MYYSEMNDNQRRVFIDTIQLYDAFRDAFYKNRPYRGGMHWKKAKCREYLFSSHDRYGYGKSLGPGTPETEKILADFRQKKQQAKNRLSALQDRRNLYWLISSPKFEEIVIGDDGMSAAVVFTVTP